MSRSKRHQGLGLKFSLRHLLTGTALIAIGTAMGLAYQRNQWLRQRLDELHSLSNHLPIDSGDKLASAELPELASDYQSWRVRVPKDAPHELRLGLGDVSERGIPPVVDRVPLAAGEHRVTLYTGDSPNAEFRYAVFLDGKPVMEKSMGRDWVPGGWTTAHGLSWPNGPRPSPAPLQLNAESYTPKVQLDDRSYFNGQSDNYVTRRGYRLWIDLTDRDYAPPSPLMGFTYDARYRGIGLRDGLRYAASSGVPYSWAFTRPKSQTNTPVLQIMPEFFGNDGATLTDQTPTFQSWKLSGKAEENAELAWQESSAQLPETAFLRAQSNKRDGLQPVVQLKWDPNRPEEVGLRLPDTPANASISRWRLRIVDGSHQLWRELKVGDRMIFPAQAISERSSTSEDQADLDDQADSGDRVDAAIPLALAPDATAPTRLRWRTNETLPLQVVERNQNQYAGLALFEGLPLALGMEIPAELRPQLSVRVVDQPPNQPDTPFPGGPVFDELQLDFDAAGREWIWLRAGPRESAAIATESNAGAGSGTADRKP